MERSKYVLFLAIAIVIWLLTFVAGISMQSGKYLQELYADFFRWSILLYIISWTWTNVVILSCTASIIGELGKTLIKGGQLHFGSAIVRGFFIYLLFIAGQLILTGTLSREIYNSEGVLDISQANYFRVGAFMSMFSFLVGYSPDFFTFLIDKAKRISGSNLAD